MSFKYILFNILCLIHILIWVFVLLAFVNKKTAFINIYFIIPLIYIIHILPFHVIVTYKKKLYPKTAMKKLQEFDNLLIIPKYFMKLTKFFDKYSFANPISGQGMLIFGLITSIYKLHPLNIRQILK
jgi:hypothetical protein